MCDPYNRLYRMAIANNVMNFKNAKFDYDLDLTEYQ